MRVRGPNQPRHRAHTLCPICVGTGREADTESAGCGTWQALVGWAAARQSAFDQVQPPVALKYFPARKVTTPGPEMLSLWSIPDRLPLPSETSK